MSIRNISITAFLLLLGGISSAMTFDNRFIPLIQRPFLTVENRPSHFAGEFFVATASKAFGQNDEEIGIPELYGPYDEQEIAKSFVALGQPNPLRTAFQGIELPWTVEGKIQAQGFAFCYEQAVYSIFSVGINWFFMHVDSRQEFYFKNNDLSRFTLAEQYELDEERRAMNTMLGLEGPNSNQFGFGDFEIYARFWNAWDYIFKFRRIEAGGRLGFFLPSGVTRNINNPASIPFGGNGHYGIYGGVDCEFELKEDWKVGALMLVIKRFARTFTERMSLSKEPYIYGPVIGPVRVSPAVTFVLSPYVSFENLREGLGVRIQYTLTMHGIDYWSDERTNKTVIVNFTDAIARSQWASDYVTLTVFYDFGKVKVARGFEPIVNFAWYVPVSLLAARDVAKTNRISLGLEYNF